MAVEISLSYEGELHCNLTHGPSGAVLQTDAPQDNQGKGAAFSPTDLLAASLLSCAVTTMALKGGVTSASGRVLKDMQSSPRRVAKLTLELDVPQDSDHAKLEDLARNCPVALSLGKDVEVEMRFHYV